MIEVCVVGEINLDLIMYGLPKDLVVDRELLAKNMAFTLGSSSAIFAHNLCTLGTKVGFVSKVGKDPLGKMAVERLAAAGVDTAHIKQGTGETSTGLTVVLPHTQHRYILTYPGTMFEMQYSDIDTSYLRTARHLHLSSFYLHRALRPRIVDLYRQAKEAGLTTSLDTNDDPENRWEQDLHQVLKYVDVFLPNDREAKKIAHTEDLACSQSSGWLGQGGGGEARLGICDMSLRRRTVESRSAEGSAGGRCRGRRYFRRRFHSPLLARSQTGRLSGIRQPYRRLFGHQGGRH